MTQVRKAFLGIAEEEMPPRPRRVLHRVPHEIGAIDPILEAGAPSIECPDDRHPVRQYEVETGKHSRKIWVVPCLGQ